jgi:hypothetical protein
VRIITKVLIVTIGVSATWRLGSSGHAGETTSVVSARPTKPAYVEVQSGQQVYRGLDSGRSGNWMLLLTRDGYMRHVRLDESARLRDLVEPFRAAPPATMSRLLRSELGPQFKFVNTAHYLICHNTDDSFAAETAELAENLHQSFLSHFGARGMGFTKPQFPLVFVVFDQESEFRRYMQGSSTAQMMDKVAGYYSMETNRVAFFNAASGSSAKYGNARWHNLSTIVHEATHQIAFNSGCHRRFADSPPWLVEGLAMYFETPELRGNKIAWGEIGKLNQPRLKRFLAYRENRLNDSIKTLVSSEKRLSDDATAADAYAEAWALTYYLINERAGQFYRYLKQQAAKPTLKKDAPEHRWEEFEAAFGRNQRLFDAAFLRYVDGLASQK